MAAPILVVDDDAAIRELLAEVLRSEGYAVETAEDGEVALTQIAQHSPAVVLLDLMMPVLDGWQTHERVRALRPDLPVVYVSAAAGVEGEAVRAGAQGYLRKPFDITAVIDLVARFAGP